MRLLLTSFLVTIFAFTLKAQNMPAFDSHALSITWQALQNDNPRKGESLNELVVTNNGKTELPASGWKFYFNSARGILSTTTTGNAVITKLNGDLFTVTPTSTFTGIKPGESVKIDFVSDEEVINISDGPLGFYLVWDDKPQKGYPIGDPKILPFSPSYPGLVTTEVIYNQNKVIKDVPEEQLTKAFPTPVSYQETSGFFSINKTVPVFINPKPNAFAKETQYLYNFLAGLNGGSLGGKLTSNQMNSINIEKINGLADEGYELSVQPSSIHIKASTSAGAFYAIQTLKTLISPGSYADWGHGTGIPCVEIKDAPRFPFRGVVLDVARNFESKKNVLKLLDAMALYKLNVLHLHLTDDEGWRIALPSLPELTSIGAERGHTLDSKHHLPPSYGSGPDTGKYPGSGFYTRADYIEILKYATERHIAVEPEIESPGHARAAVKAMAARYNRLLASGKKAEAEKYLLTDPNDKSVYESVQYWNDNVIDVSMPSTYNFFQTVINDLTAMYKEANAPLHTIHFGGDEVPAHVWEKSPSYLAFKAKHPEITDPKDMWYYFYGRLHNMLAAKGLSLAGWEEMALRKTMLDNHPSYVPNPDFVPYHIQADVWNNSLGDGQEDLAYKLANAGYKVVLSSVTNLYFDMAHYKSFDEPGYYWGAFVDVDKPFSFIPYDYFKNTKVDKNGKPLSPTLFVGKQRLTDYGKGNIMGLQGCLWHENVRNLQRSEYMMYPNLLGLAERAWAADPQWATEPDTAKSSAMYALAWSNFVNILGKRELPRLDNLDGGYGYRIPKPGVILQDGKYLANMQFPGFVIRYTTDGSEPAANSPVYNSSVTITSDKVKFRSFDTKGRGSGVSEPVIHNQQ
jgi:hexosaminidase